MVGAELREFFRSVRGNADDLNPDLVEWGEAVAEIAGFFGTSWGVCARVEEQDNPFATEVGKETVAPVSSLRLNSGAGVPTSSLMRFSLP